MSGLIHRHHRGSGTADGSVCRGVVRRHLAREVAVHSSDRYPRRRVRREARSGERHSGVGRRDAGRRDRQWPTDQVPTIFEDVATVGLKFIIKDMGNPGGEASPSKVNQIMVNRYRVVYRRADGRNTQGVDVPYTFDGAITLTVDESAKLTSFALVRIQAKEEEPLKSLAGGGGRVAIATIADVTFYGHDMAGNAVQQTGSISINFADWGDPD